MSVLGGCGVGLTAWWVRQQVRQRIDIKVKLACAVIEDKITGEDYFQFNLINRSKNAVFIKGLYVKSKKSFTKYAYTPKNTSLIPVFKIETNDNYCYTVPIKALINTLETNEHYFFFTDGLGKEWRCKKNDMRKIRKLLKNDIKLLDLLKEHNVDCFLTTNKSDTEIDIDREPKSYVKLWW